MAVLSLDDAKSNENIRSSADDAELAATIDEAQAAIETRIGPLEPTTRTDRLNGPAAALLLRVAPVVSLTSVSDANGNAVDVSTLWLDKDAGSLVFADGYTRFVSRFYTVTYVAGYPDGECPADLVRAVKAMTSHLWDTQRGPTVMPGQGDDAPSPSYLIPNQVLELIEPYRVPSVA